MPQFNPGDKVQIIDSSNWKDYSERLGVYQLMKRRTIGTVLAHEEPDHYSVRFPLYIPISLKESELEAAERSSEQS